MLCRHKILLGLGNGQKTDPSSLPDKPQELQGEGLRAPPRTWQMPSVVQGQRWSWTLASLSPKLPMGSQDLSCSRAQPHPRAGCRWLPGSRQPRAGRQALASRGEPTPNPPAGGYFYLPSLVSNLPVSKLPFPLRAIFSPRSAVLGRCVGQPAPGLCRAPQPQIVNHSRSLSKQHKALTMGSLPLIITSAYTLGLKYMVRNRSV